MSRRAKKRVDYSQFGLGEDDDDFAEFTPPTSKRQKTSASNKSVDNEDKGKRKAPKSRPSIDDKIYERELQAALELSISESQPSVDPYEPVDLEEKENIKDKGQNVKVTDNNVKEKTKDVKVKPEEVKTIVTKAVISPNKVDSEDEIVVLETDVQDKLKSTGRTPRRAAVKKVVIEDDESDAGSDFKLDEEEDTDDNDSDNDFNEDEYDSDFNDNKSTKSKTKEKEKPKKQPVRKAKSDGTKATIKRSTKATPVSWRTPTVSGSGLNKASTGRSTPQSNPSTGRSTPQSHPSTGRSTPQTRPSVASPMPRWNPPGPAVTKTPTNSGVPLKSPLSGLRVGLSRNMKLKPLHPNLKIKH